MRLQQQSLLIVNAVGGVMAGALAVAVVWEVALRPSTASAELHGLKAAFADQTRDLAALEHELDNQGALLEERRTTLIADGAPPARTPIEDNLRTIAELARRHGLELSEVTPLGTASYPGILEARYRVRGRGTYASLVETLRQFEACDFWGDVTHLQIERPKNQAGPRSDLREMDLTVSFYSVTDSEASPAVTR